jgi:hypothetical protein
VLDAAGHFPWLDHPDAYWPVIKTFVRERSGGRDAPSDPEREPDAGPPG